MFVLRERVVEGCPTSSAGAMMMMSGTQAM